MGADVLHSLEGLPDRYRGPYPTSARFRLRIDRLVRDVVINVDSCEVMKAAGTPDTEICTDKATWMDIDSGRLSGIEAFTKRRLVVRGSIEKALQFEPLFSRPDNGGLRYSIEQVRAGRLNISVLIAGDERAEPLLLLHGLGATKASWLTAVSQLAARYRVIVPDIPGYGASSKPIGPYNAPWFAARMFDFVDSLGYSEVRVAGNSMGGRIAQEMALMDPQRVSSIACLCPVTAFSDRPALQFIRILRPELGIAVGRLPRARLSKDLRALFCDPTRIEETWYEAAIDDFLRTWRSPRARLAFFASARNLFLDEPYGDNGFWARLETMDVPALYIFGAHDVLITARFAQKVRKKLPSAHVEVWNDCGHVPQLEHPDRTADKMISFFSSRVRRPSDLVGTRRA